MVRVLLVDNHDSFTYNLVQMVRKAENAVCTVVPHNKIRIEEVAGFDKILFSPGPGLPREFPVMSEILHAYASSMSMLGVCLGHQAIAEHFGGKLMNLAHPLHGRRQRLQVLHSEGVVMACGSDTHVGLYHSWVVDSGTIPTCLTVTSVTDSGLVMSLLHNKFDIQGVQFHPESYMTDSGQQMIEAWLAS